MRIESIHVRRSGRWRLRWVGLLMSLCVALWASCGDDDGIAVLECEGSCSCDQDSRTCTCQGGTLCEVAGEDDITLICEGNAGCDLDCEARCHVECPGTSDCVATMGDDSTAVCNGSGTCEYFCEGDCSVDCPGSAQCTVHCNPGSACDITSCQGGSLVECDSDMLTCRQTCPQAD